MINDSLAYLLESPMTGKDFKEEIHEKLECIQLKA